MRTRPSRIVVFILAMAFASAPLRAEEILPNQWAGSWSGYLEIFPQGNGLPKKVPVTLEAQPREEGQWRWKMVFDPQGKPVVKDYRLLPGKNGRLVMDENNGIQLEGTRRGNTLLFLFRVDGILLDTRYRLGEDGTLTMETTTYSVSKIQKPGEEKPARVDSIPVQSFQAAVMKRDTEKPKP